MSRRGAGAWLAGVLLLSACSSGSGSGSGSGASGGERATGGCVFADQAPLARGKLGDACPGPCEYDGDYAAFYCKPDKPQSPPLPICYSRDGLHCDFATHRCIARYPAGQACEFTNQCVDSSYCKNSVCAPREAIGASCKDANDVGGSCVPGAYCNDAFLCAQQVGPGSACRFDDCAGKAGACLDNGCGICDEATRKCVADTPETLACNNAP